MTYIAENIGPRPAKEYLDEILEIKGPFQKEEDMAEEIIQNYIGKVPDILIDFWRHHGLGILPSNGMRLCLPSDFEDILAIVFDNDKELKTEESYVVGYDSFGRLLIWNTEHRMIHINFLDYIVVATGLIYKEDEINPNVNIITDLLISKAGEYLDVNNKKLLARAQKKLGLPKKGECYGFAPALAMGGEPTLDNLKIMPIHAHLSFLAQLDQFKLVDYLASPIQVVRLIGDDSDNHSSPTNTTNSSSKNKSKQSWFKRLFGR